MPWNMALMGQAPSFSYFSVDYLKIKHKAASVKGVAGWEQFEGVVEGRIPSPTTYKYASL